MLLEEDDKQRVLRGAVARVGGMTLGVTIGCLLGMAPCLWLEPRRHTQPTTDACPA